MRLTSTIDGSQAEIETSVRMTLAEAVPSLRGDHVLPMPCRSATCGACTVLMNDAPVLSCITPAALYDGAKLTTAASLARDTRLAALQNLFADSIFQPCGNCASGFLASAAALLDANPRPTRDDVRYALAGHACLCVGYGAILDAVTAGAAVVPDSSPKMQPPEPLPSHEEIARALAQERDIARDRTADPLARLRLQLPAAAVGALDSAAVSFGWSQRHSTAEPSQRQLCGSWVALQKTERETEKNGAIVFVELQVDAETEIVSLRSVATLLLGVAESPDTISESGVMRGIFLALRPQADAAEHLFPSDFPTSIDLPDISHFSPAKGDTTVDAMRKVRRDVSLATLRAIAGAISKATGRFPGQAPFAPDWSNVPDLDNASNIS